jgi:hypothetical protein
MAQSKNDAGENISNVTVIVALVQKKKKKKENQRTR